MILYFSGTGNSKYCAKMMSDLVHDKIGSINLNLKNNIYDIDMHGEQILGIIVPTYDYDLPWIVKEYLSKIHFNNISKGIYTFGVFTCGGKSSGMCAKRLEKILNSKGIKLNYNKTVPMPDNYILMYKLDTSKNDDKLKKADFTIKNIVDDINSRANNKCKAQGYLFSKLSKLIINSQMDTRKFKVSDECMHCGLCSKICPINIIKMVNGKPKWSSDKCACCLGCINRCPKRAISKGRMSIKNEHYYNKQVDYDGLN